MIDLSMFRKADQDLVISLLNMHDYHKSTAEEYAIEGEFSKAAADYRNVAHTFEQLQELKKAKQMQDQAYLVLKQIEGEQERRELLQRLSK
ncbi:hypothetical protein [Lentibacillus saliphilus]|uniref:hypothetical protein n=1 Tax=Lentibacillus saliphilus TaxID=2737028 RepID=UPI001C3032CB|nr:hypothetical protein [Lentibacillus saliphilus]